MAAMLLLLAVFISAYTGFACFALSQVRHWRAVISGSPPRRGVVLVLRSLGSMLLGASLALALVRDGPSFGSLLFATNLSLAALAVVFTLAWRSRRRLQRVVCGDGLSPELNASKKTENTFSSDHLQ